MRAWGLEEHPLHLGLGATAEVQPAITAELSWYEAYGLRHASDGAEGRLVSLHTFTEAWASWEMHPQGAEVVLCIEGAMTLIQEQPGGTLQSVELVAGHYTINPPGVWHTADVGARATAVFITAGEGTQHRPRWPDPDTA